MKKIQLLYCFTVLFVLSALCQQDLPTDYLSPAFHAARRDSLRRMMPPNSVMAIFAFPTRTYSNDVAYVYHANPDLYYFSGYTEPNALLLIFKDQQKYKDSVQYNEVFFVQKKNALREQWTGRRQGVEGVKQELKFSLVFNGEDFQKFPIDLSSFDKIIFDELPDNASANADRGDLSQLVAAFRNKAGIPADYDPVARQDLIFVKQRANPRNSEQLQNFLKRNLAAAKYKDPSLITSYLQADSIGKQMLFAKVENEKWNNGFYTAATDALREVKTPEEMELLRKAVEISAIAHTEVMKAVRPDMSEREIEGIHDYVQKKYGAEHWGYPAIVGAGNNGCVLHYEENNKTSIGQKMLLMDVGAEYHGYSADVTRTVPANGKFSAEEKTIYNIVYEAQEEAFKLCKEGSSFQDIEMKAREIVANGLIKLGLIKTAADSRKYYPHGCSHHIGLDVHDKGSYDKLKKNMVITIEPGIYIPEGSDCDKKWWGIAVRIEDDLLIKEKGYELLSAFAPRKAEDVEKMVAQKSGFDDLKLPALKSVKKGF